jgi:hypothetical protein
MTIATRQRFDRIAWRLICLHDVDYAERTLARYRRRFP